MATCVVVGTGGSVVAQDPQPTDLSTCSSMLISGGEYTQLGGIFQPLSTTDATAIGTAIWLCWAVAWGTRALVQLGGSTSIDSHERGES